ncbi:class II aldolase/adducin family protein [Actinomadura darangshiensis]|uniref:Class II aldolase/adducin family protein n=1 Tax=Actinomadura darangshiensis TaxID=705336 RepID=A0A4V2YVF9_9ACTN|nr:class II aldolase/adducin family protein [Actinomadura darangshiensis]TDD81337.1 class II aldolase/adducin family protein [Actinomadura darangshiensis]
MTETFAEQRLQIADACRVLAMRGLADGILGHISRRVGPDRILIRCRGPHERGLAHTTAADVRLLDLDGAPAAEGELDGGWRPPNELPLHTEVLRARPDVQAVVHAHPPAVVAADLAGLAIRPVIGAFDIPGARLAQAGVPVYPRGVLVRDRRLAAEMVAALGAKAVVLLRGHGITSTGGTVPEAVLRAKSVDAIARMSLTVASAGGTLRDLPGDDLAELPDLGSAFDETTAWRHELSRLQ